MNPTQTFPSRRTTAGCLVAAGLLILIGFAVTPWESEQTARAYHDALAAHPGQAQAAAVILHFGYMLLVPAAFGIMALLAARGGWLFKIGAVLSIAGMSTMPGLLVTDAYDLTLAQELPRGQSASVTEAVGELVLTPVIALPAFVGVVLGSILLFVALWRAGEVGGHVPLLVAAGWLVPLAGFDLVLTLVGGVLLLAGFALGAARIARPESSLSSAAVPAAA